MVHAWKFVAAARYILAALGLTAVPASAMAQLSANFGMLSDYMFRGIFQEDSTAFAGLDYAHDSGLYIGTWGAEVGTGMETDLYFGYSGSAGDFGWGVGFLGVYYTDDWDDTYEEFDFNVSYGGLSLHAITGEYGGFGTPYDYTYLSIGYAFDNGAYINVGSWDEFPFPGEYAEIGYGFDFMGLDLSMALIASDDLPVSEGDNFNPDDNATFNIVFGVSKSIPLGQ